MRSSLQASPSSQAPAAKSDTPTPDASPSYPVSRVITPPFAGGAPPRATLLRQVEIANLSLAGCECAVEQLPAMVDAWRRVGESKRERASPGEYGASRYNSAAALLQLCARVDRLATRLHQLLAVTSTGVAGPSQTGEWVSSAAGATDDSALEPRTREASIDVELDFEEPRDDTSTQPDAMPDDVAWPADLDDPTERMDDPRLAEIPQALQDSTDDEEADDEETTRGAAPMAPSIVVRHTTCALDDQRLETLYEACERARRACRAGGAGIPFADFAARLRLHARKLQSEHGRQVDYAVVIRNRRPCLKPILHR